MITLHDVYRVRAEPRLIDANKTERHRFIDSVLNVEDSSKRGLVVKFNLSNAGRRINNRIYLPVSQKAAAGGATGKPIYKDHKTDTVDNIIGRFIDVKYNDLEEQAVPFFSSVGEMMKVKRALDSKDPVRIADALASNKLLTNDEWQGFGELEARARITDSKAIEKFIDETYMDFSVGAHADCWLCSICAQDWYGERGPCKHKPGRVYNGKIALNVLDGFHIDEGSVVTDGANRFSKVRSLEVRDGANIEIPEDFCDFDDDVIMFTDSKFEEGVAMFPKTADGNLDVQALAELLVPVLADKMGATLAETLAAQIDEKLKDKLQPVTDTTGVEDTDKVKTEAVVADAQTAEEQTNTETQQAVTDQAPEVDWYLLDAALDRELGANALALADREALAQDSFCGPEKMFPVTASDHVAAARRVLERTKFGDAVKAHVIGLLDARAAAIDAAASAPQVVDKAEHDQLVKDYAEALKQIEALRADVAKAKEEKVEVTTSKLDTVTDSQQNGLDNQTDASTAITDVKAVESPSNGSSEEGTVTGKINDYERSIINRYKDIKTSEGEAAADRFIAVKVRKRHLPRTFDIKTFLEEN